MVPFDSRTPFTSSGVRVGTAAITTRGVKDDVIPSIVEMIDKVISNIGNESVIAEVRKDVNDLMGNYKLFAY